MTNPIRGLTNTVEAKVVAAAAGGAGGGVLGAFILWLLGVLVWHQPDTALKAADAVSAVPGPVAALVPFVLGGAAAFVAGYLAPHTSRVPGAHAAPAGRPAPASTSSPPLAESTPDARFLPGQPGEPDTLLASGIVGTVTSASLQPTLDGLPPITADTPGWADTGTLAATKATLPEPVAAG